MGDIIQLDLAPSAAILNSSDAELPVKTRDFGANQPRFLLQYSSTGLIQRAFWTWPLSQQDVLGTILGTGLLRVHWTANTVLTDNVRWSAKAGFVTEADQYDKVLGAPVAVTQAFSGTAKNIHMTPIPLSGLVTGLPTGQSGFLVVCLERDNTVLSNLAATVELMKSVLQLDFVSKLRENGPVIASYPVIASSVVLTPSLLGYHIIVDTNVIGGNATVYLASNASTLPIASEHDGFSYFISKMGPHQVDIDVDPGGGGLTTGIRGAAIPILLLADGDSVRLSYTSYDDKYQVW